MHHLVATQPPATADTPAEPHPLTRDHVEVIISASRAALETARTYGVQSGRCANDEAMARAIGAMDKAIERFYATVYALERPR